MEEQADLSCLSCNSDRIVVGQVNLHRAGEPHPWSIVAPAFTPNELQKNTCGHQDCGLSQSRVLVSVWIVAWCGLPSTPKTLKKHFASMAAMS